MGNSKTFICSLDGFYSFVKPNDQNIDGQYLIPLFLKKILMKKNPAESTIPKETDMTFTLTCVVRTD